MPRRPTAKSLTRELTARLGVDGLAKRVGVTEATVRRWLKNGPPASRREDVEEAFDRAERARKAAETRARQAKEREAEARQAAERRSEAAREGWRSRRFREAREEALRDAGFIRGRRTITGERGDEHEALTALIRDRDPAWLRFLEQAEAEGRSSDEARSEWYSPTAKKGEKLRRKKKRKKKNRR